LESQVLFFCIFAVFVYARCDCSMAIGRNDLQETDKTERQTNRRKLSNVGRWQTAPPSKTHKALETPLIIRFT